MRSNEDKTQAQIQGLATILVLADELKKLSTLREFGFYSTNETHRLVPYDTAFLWQKKEFSTVVLAQSGTAELDENALANQWLQEVIHKIMELPNANTLHEVSMQELFPEKTPSVTDAKHELPNFSLWCPFLNKRKEISGGLLFFRETAFTESEIKMLSWLIASYEYTWQVLTRRSFTPSWKRIKEKNITIIIIACIIGFLLFPIRLSVLGTATVTPSDPVFINAPLHGVIKSFAVRPGQQVKQGQLLLTFDKTELSAEEELNKKAFQLTQVKLRTMVNQSFENAESRSEIPSLQKQLDIDKARIDYTTALLAKTSIVSPVDGIVVFDSKEDWVGQPVQTGEKILVIADPKQVQLKIMLPVSNVIKLKIGGAGEFFLYGQLRSIPIEITTLGYNAKLMPNKILAYQIQAKFRQTTELPQLGAEGSARLYGDRVPLIYYLLRRPMEAIRQTFGI